MKFLSACVVVASAVSSALGDTIELRYPIDGTVLPINQNFTAQVVLPVRYSPQIHNWCLPRVSSPWHHALTSELPWH